MLNNLPLASTTLDDRPSRLLALKVLSAQTFEVLTPTSLPVPCTRATRWVGSSLMPR